MLLLSCSAKLRLLEGMLRRSLPETLPVHGVVMNINRRNPAGHEVLVDSWPEFTAVLTRSRRQVATDDSDFYTNTYAAYYRDLSACQALLSSAVNWDQAFHIHGLQDGLHMASREIAKAAGGQLEVCNFFTYLHPDPSTMPEIRLDSAMRLSSLDVSHADLLNETWPYGGTEQSRRYLSDLICCFPSSCLLDTACHPISWCLIDSFGAMVHGYTLPQHRGHGYVRVVSKVMAKQMHARGYPTYSHVSPDNHRAQRLQESQGFWRQPGLCYIIIHTPGPVMIPS
ncbi:glycine-N-acyltransferase-like protein 3 [Emydura macquarii macquarii]|uniref:glycine-N-acyltransferase-like protein 3 n=1 Tax=Emydura macquarii macquarii TaxID=1129001 RepID=UPI00352A02C5